MAKTMRRRRVSVERSLGSLARRLEEVETIARENRRALELQFRRIADIQVQIDRLLEQSRRTR